MNPLLFALFIQASETTAQGPLSRLQNGPPLSTFMTLSFLLFILGVAGVLTRRNIIIIFMSIELILNAVNLNMIAFSRYYQLAGGGNIYTGQIFTIFIIVVAAAEAAIGLGIVIAMYRNRETVKIDEIDLLKW